MERPMPEDRTADERTTLLGLLDWYREGVVQKVAGLTDEQAAARHVDSPSTPVGLVKHLALVEDWWFTEQVAGRPASEPWAGVDWDADPDWEFTTAREDRLEDVVAMYVEACERSRAVIAEASFEDVYDRGPRGPFSLRWVIVHMLEETARHLGHLDILRELTDGATGE